MTHYLGNADYTHGTASTTGVLLTNLGTPDAPTPSALRRYLGEFLADPRVVELPRWLWWLVLHGVILRIRPPRSARAYQQIWTEQGSPLLVFSEALAAALTDTIHDRLDPSVQVVLGMRYGQPSLPAALDRLRQAQVQRLLVLPLYPQYSATTTASTFDALSAELRRWRRLPELRFIQHYHDFNPYISAMAEHIREHWHNHGRGQKLLLSFHGLPKRYLFNGDPYHCECYKTARLLATELHLQDHEWQVTFQSRFGREPWLQPYTDHVLQALPAENLHKVDVFCPGFAVDCLETLEEIALQNRDIFLTAGGQKFQYIPALNATDGHITALTELIVRHCQGWVHTSDSTELTRDRALALGAQQ